MSATTVTAIREVIHIAIERAKAEYIEVMTTGGDEADQAYVLSRIVTLRELLNTIDALEE